MLDKRKKKTPKFQLNNLVRTADLKRTFSKSDTTNWSYKLYEITEFINDTIPTYEIDKSDTHRILNRQSKLSFDDKIAE